MAPTLLRRAPSYSGLRRRLWVLRVRAASRTVGFSVIGGRANRVR